VKVRVGDKVKVGPLNTTKIDAVKRAVDRIGSATWKRARRTPASTEDWRRANSAIGLSELPGENRPAIDRLKENNMRVGSFERDQFEGVREHLPEPLRPLATFLLLTGWRRSEVLSLR
jgi:integrase